MKRIVSTRGQVVLPVELRRQDDIEPGQELEIERLGRGEYRLVRREPLRNHGLLDWLLDCPEKGFFVPLGELPTGVGGEGDGPNPVRKPDPGEVCPRSQVRTGGEGDLDGPNPF